MEVVGYKVLLIFRKCFCRFKNKLNALIMNRDMDLLRSILFEVEKAKTIDDWIPIKLTGISEKEINYHIMLAMDGGLLIGKNLSTKSGVEYGAKSLTYKGHDFLDKIRNDGIWNKTKSFMSKNAIPMTIEFITTIATGFVKNKIGAA